MQADRGPYLEAELTLTANSSNNTLRTGVLSVQGATRDSNTLLPKMPHVQALCTPKIAHAKGTHADHNGTTATAVTQQ